LNSFFLNKEQNNYVVESAEDSGAKEKVKMMGTGEDVKDIGLKLGLTFLHATTPPSLPLKERKERFGPTQQSTK